MFNNQSVSDTGLRVGAVHRPENWTEKDGPGVGFTPAQYYGLFYSWKTINTYSKMSVLSNSL